MLLLYSWAGQDRRARLVSWWSRGLLRLSGVRVNVRGKPLTGKGGLWIANHVSWVDIFLLNGVQSTSFIAKQEIRNWPVLGLLVASVGTLFIERGNRRAVPRISELMRERFERGQRIGLFPEGTTSDGLDVLHFHGGLFEAALRSGAAIQPVALCYRHHGKRSDFAAYVGDQSLAQNVWKLWGGGGVSVDVVFLPELAGTDEPDVQRQVVARRAYEAIRREVIKEVAEPATEARVAQVV
ncbi:1-acyl-sn-glycerol-3-phosphate acyltransferase [Pigmentiphaga aceris]|uniref:1-acyl-sn-glycerol-3-phosphate acyltransferase n=2 Tax=Pigmentiphaga aceris TaxID=1940612 RepID=A0A5C0B7E3_9BURK|nr:1-acyl-sn-glycerol-3-phosphate acyltransferase [Pigmentiphaga aceris]